MSGRTLLSVAAVLFSGSVFGAQPLLAQGSSLPFPIPIPPELLDLLTHPSVWFVRTFNEVIRQVGGDVVGWALGTMHWLLDSGNIVTRTPPELSYDSEVVRTSWQTVAVAADTGLAAVAAWSGLNVIIRPYVRAPYNGALELIPRLLLTAIVLNTSLFWGHFAIDLNNALCSGFGATSVPALATAGNPAGETNPLLELVAVGIYLIMGMLLFSQMMMRLALLDALLIVGPLAILCWALPQTYSWARLWFTTFFATVFVQFLQVLVLHLGSDLITHLPQVFGGGANPLDAGRAWLMTLILGVAVLQLARKIPRLMPGYAGGAALTQDNPLAVIRSVQQGLRRVSGKR